MKKELVLLPAESELAALTARGALLEAEIEQRREELADIKARLEAYALAHPEQHVPLEDAAREGRRVLLPGGVVRLESDVLIASFEDGGDKHAQLRGILHDAPRLKLFFDPPSCWTRRTADGNKFRARVRDELAPSTAAAFIAACRAVDRAGLPKSRTVIEFAGREGA